MYFSAAVDSQGVDKHQLVLDAVRNTGQSFRKVMVQILAPLEPAASKAFVFEFIIYYILIVVVSSPAFFSN